MNPLKLLFLFLSILLSFCSINPANAQFGTVDVKGGISLFPWETIDTTKVEDYCIDAGYMTDMSQVTVEFRKIDSQNFEITCIDPNDYFGYPTPIGFRFNPYTVTVTRSLPDGLPYESYSQNLHDYCGIQELNDQITNLKNPEEYIRFTPLNIKSENKLQINCQNTMNGQLAQLEIYYKDENQPQPQIEGCTDSTAINYNPQANVHKESMCEYPPSYNPQDITGAFQKSQVSIGATTWTIRVNLNVPNANLDPSVIQTWNRFKAVSATTNEKTLEIVMRQFDDQRLEIEECTSYELTIPRNALYTTEGDTNANPISGNFEVIGCQEKIPDPVDTGTGTTQTKHENTIKENNFYLSLYDTDENGKVYLNLTNIIYFVGFLSFFSVLFFVLFGFIKNSFLGKSKKFSR